MSDEAKETIAAEEKSEWKEIQQPRGDSNVPHLDEKAFAPTEITVEKPEPSEEDVPDEALAKTIKESPEVAAAYDKVKEECLKQYEERMKNEEINLDEIIYEDEEKLIPLVTDEDLKLFDAVSDSMFGQTDIETYVQMAKDDILAWKELKKNYDDGILDGDDLEYFESSTKSKDESKILLITIQNECKKLRNDFETSHVAENTIRTAIYKLLADFTLSKYRFNRTWVDGNAKLEDCDSGFNISKDIKEHMFVTTMFYRQIERMLCKSKSSLKLNPFHPLQFNSYLDQVVFATSNYIKNSGIEQDAMAVGKVLDKDFKAMNFTKPILAYALVKYDDLGLIKSEEGSDLDSRVLSNAPVLAPNEESQTKMKELSNIVKALVVYIKTNIDKVQRLANLYKENFMNDPLYKKLPADLDLNDFKNSCVEISSFIPDLTTITIPKWGNSYSFFQKYIRWYLFNDTLNMIAIALKEKKEDEIDRIIFSKLITALVDDVFMFLYADIVTSLHTEIKSSFDKETRTVMFATVINNILLQHEFGFKSIIDKPEEYKNEDGSYNKTKMYEVAKTIFGERFEFMVDPNQDEDVFLKDVNLFNVKTAYIETCTYLIISLLDEFDAALTSIDDMEKDYHDCVNNANKKNRPLSKNKSKKKKRK